MLVLTSLEVDLPQPNREFLAYNPNSTARNKSRIINFGPRFTPEQIRYQLEDEGFTLWTYIEVDPCCLN